MEPPHLFLTCNDVLISLVDLDKLICSYKFYCALDVCRRGRRPFLGGRVVWRLTSQPPLRPLRLLANLILLNGCRLKVDRTVSTSMA